MARRNAFHRHDVATRIIHPVDSTRGGLDSVTHRSLPSQSAVRERKKGKNTRNSGTRFSVGYDRESNWDLHDSQNHNAILYRYLRPQAPPRSADSTGGGHHPIEVGPPLACHLRRGVSSDTPSAKRLARDEAGRQRLIRRIVRRIGSRRWQENIASIGRGPVVGGHVGRSESAAARPGKLVLCILFAVCRTFRWAPEPHWRHRIQYYPGRRLRALC